MRKLFRALLLALVAVTAAASARPQVAPPPMTFGVLGSSCSPGRMAALRQAGVTMVELPVAWDRYQPEVDAIDHKYVDEVRSRIESCRAAGMAIVLAPGLQYPPAWVRALPGGMLRGNFGAVPNAGSIDLVFSAAVRNAAGNYLAHLASDVGFNSIAAVRVGTNATGELGYPGPEAGGNSHEYWSFGAAPQMGVGLANGMARSPMPVWAPGSPLWAGREVTPEQADVWWSWYTRSAVDAVAWQAARLRELGYTGRVHVPVAGRGVLPADRAEAVAALLDGRADPDGSLERGLDYPTQFSRFAGLDGLDVDFTGLDDDTAVRARAANPAQDRCMVGDSTGSLSRPEVSLWPSQRFTTAVARRAGLGLVGENPGPPNAPFTGGSRWSDTIDMQLQWAPAYAAECGMSMFLFAFENDLFDRPTADGDGGRLTDYAIRISRQP
jgi:hypothetical protein